MDQHKFFLNNKILEAHQLSKHCHLEIQVQDNHHIDIHNSKIIKASTPLKHKVKATFHQYNNPLMEHIQHLKEITMQQLMELLLHHKIVMPLHLKTIPPILSLNIPSNLLMVLPPLLSLLDTHLQTQLTKQVIRVQDFKPLLTIIVVLSLQLRIAIPLPKETLILLILINQIILKGTTNLPNLIRRLKLIHLDHPLTVHPIHLSHSRQALLLKQLILHR